MHVWCGEYGMVEVAGATKTFSGAITTFDTIVIASDTNSTSDCKLWMTLATATLQMIICLQLSAEIYPFHPHKIMKRTLTAGQSNTIELIPAFQDTSASEIQGNLQNANSRTTSSGGWRQI